MVHVASGFRLLPIYLICLEGPAPIISFEVWKGARLLAMCRIYLTGLDVVPIGEVYDVMIGIRQGCSVDVHRGQRWRWDSLGGRSAQGGNTERQGDCICQQAISISTHDSIEPVSGGMPSLMRRSNSLSVLPKRVVKFQ